MLRKFFFIHTTEYPVVWRIVAWPYTPQGLLPLLAYGMSTLLSTYLPMILTSTASHRLGDFICNRLRLMEPYGFTLTEELCSVALLASGLLSPDRDLDERSLLANLHKARNRRALQGLS